MSTGASTNGLKSKLKQRISALVAAHMHKTQGMRSSCPEAHSWAARDACAARTASNCVSAGTIKRAALQGRNYQVSGAASTDASVNVFATNRQNESTSSKRLI